MDIAGRVRVQFWTRIIKVLNQSYFDFGPGGFLFELQTDPVLEHEADIVSIAVRLR